MANANIVQYFYEGLTHTDRMMVDASTGGALMNMTTAQATIILEEIASTSQQFGSRRAAHTTLAFKISKSSNIEQQMAALANLVKKAFVAPS